MKTKYKGNYCLGRKYKSTGAVYGHTRGLQKELTYAFGDYVEAYKGTT
jgi:hypothetical protein